LLQNVGNVLKLIIDISIFPLLMGGMGIQTKPLGYNSCVFFYLVNASGVVLGNASSISVSTKISGISISNNAFSIHTSTTAPTNMPAHTTAKQMSKDNGRKFDGLSFFGGMILGAVICVILLFSVKYYQAKKRSYHSL
jgi:hypothetical protein